MSDLQELKDAIDTFVYVPDDGATRIVVEAARKYANPDIEAAAKAVSIYVHGYSPLSPDQMRLLEKQLSVGVNAALGVTEAITK